MKKLGNPFLSLRPYTSAQKDRFFGRTSDLTLTKSRIFSARTTLLFAGSGVGKSSFLDALLVPALESDWCIVTHKRWTGIPPLQGVLESLSDKLKMVRLPAEQGLLQAVQNGTRASEKSPVRFLLILDQFEEVFQNWRDTENLVEFATALSGLAYQAPSFLDIRLLFSMREEFLGELSLFDNLIPDLFGNVYRLKNFTRDQADLVIESTTRWAEATYGAGSEDLLDDLVGMRSTAPDIEKIPGTKLGRRSRIRPPMLQIVCYRLWENQMKEGVTEFLGSYESGTAKQELEQYCKSRIDHELFEREKQIASDAFGYLMTRRGAKMPYELDHLAEHMEVPKEDLQVVLDKLSADNVRILRRTPGGSETSLWYELYHDMYAPFLFQWKHLHDEEQRRREEIRQQEEIRTQVSARTKTERLSIAALALAVFSFVAYSYFQDYVAVSGFLERPFGKEKSGSYAEVAASLERLRFFPLGLRERWARLWHARAMESAVQGDRLGATISMFEAIRQEAGVEENGRRMLSALIGGDYQNLIKTFSLNEGERLALLAVSDRGVILGSLRDGRIRFWDRSSGRSKSLEEPLRFEKIKNASEGSDTSAGVASPGAPSSRGRDSEPALLLPQAFSQAGDLALISSVRSSSSGDWVGLFRIEASKQHVADMIWKMKAPDDRQTLDRPIFRFSSDGKNVLVSTDKGLVLRGIEKNSSPRVVTPSGVLSAAFSTQGDQIVTFGLDSGIEVRDANTLSKRWGRKFLMPFIQEDDATLRFLNRASIVSVSDDSVVLQFAKFGSTTRLVMYDRHKNTPVWQRELPFFGPMEKSPKGSILILTRKEVREIDTQTGDEIAPPRPMPFISANRGISRFRSVFPVLWASENFVLTASDVSGVQEWRLRNAETERGVTRKDREDLHALSQDGQWMITTAKDGTYVRSTTQAVAPKRLPLKGEWKDFDFRKDGSAVLAVRDIEEAPRAQPEVVLLGTQELNMQKFPAASLGFKPDSISAKWANAEKIAVVATSALHQVCALWDSRSPGSRPFPVKDCEGLEVSQDGKWAVVRKPSYDALVVLSLSGGDVPKRTLPDSEGFKEFAWSSDSTKVLGYTENKTRIWHIDRPVLMSDTIRQDEDTIFSKFGPGADFVSTISKDELSVWRISDHSTPVLTIRLTSPVFDVYGERNVIGILAEGFFHSLMLDASGQPVVYSQPVNFSAMSSHVSFSSEKLHILRSSYTEWISQSVRYDLGDIIPYQKPRDSTWNGVIEEWNIRLGRRINADGEIVPSFESAS